MTSCCVTLSRSTRVAQPSMLLARRTNRNLPCPSSSTGAASMSCMLAAGSRMQLKTLPMTTSHCAFLLPTAQGSTSMYILSGVLGLISNLQQTRHQVSSTQRTLLACMHDNVTSWGFKLQGYRSSHYFMQYGVLQGNRESSGSRLQTSFLKPAAAHVFPSACKRHRCKCLQLC